MTRRGPRRRPGRPRANPGVATGDPRAEILEQAAAVFSRKGIEATRITDIAAAVGVRAPTIYHYFENLDDIVGELLEYVVAESAAFARRTAAEPGPAPGRLAAVLEDHLHRITTGPYDLWFVARLTDEEGRRFPSVARRADDWRRAVETIIEQGSAAGELRAADPVFARAMVSGMVYGALELRHRGHAVDVGEIAGFIVGSLRAAD